MVRLRIQTAAKSVNGFAEAIAKTDDQRNRSGNAKHGLTLESEAAD
jgi:hypothetical protein